MRYAIIKSESHRFSIRQMCRILSVSVSGYYAWLNRKPSSRRQDDENLKLKIQSIFSNEKARSGAPRITRIGLTH